MRRHGYTPPRVQLSIISDDEPPPPPYEDAPPSEPSEPPMKRFLKWPYYRAPDGWVVHPAWNPSVRPLNWTAFVPSASPKGRTRPAPPSPSLSGMPLVQKLQYAQPSPFFARVPAQGVSDPNFVAYRQAQATAATSHKHPTLHPILAHYSDQTTSSVHLDLAAPVDLSHFLSTAYVRLYPEELDTFITHPPVRILRLVLVGLPTLRHTLSVPAPGGITLRGLVTALAAWATRALRTDEWTTLDKPTRERIRATHQRRVGMRRTPARIAAGETAYRVIDALGERTMFMALERLRGRTDGGEDVYLVHTTTRARCVVWR